ncbi:MAG: hypothetical protein F6K19_49290 [Cyanothece sp. SIO1E1]|nr:hypothetical protein [Cyanothece sp. SIO1E1]
MNPELIDRIRSLVRKGKIRDVLNLFDESVNDPVILSLKSRLEILLEKKIKGELTFEQETTETNKIVNSLLNWTDKLDAVPTNHSDDKSLQVDKSLILLIKARIRSSLGFYYIISSVLLLLGIILIIIFHLDNGLSTVEGLGSALVCTTSGLPIREIINRRDRLLFLEVLLLKVDSISSVTELERINNLSWAMIESAVLNSKFNG